MTEESIRLTNESDIIVARRVGREMAKELGFGLADQTRLVTAISELTRNAFQHANDGICIITDASDRDTANISVVVEDHGPGIADIDQAMQYGFSTKGQLGAGLPGTRRLVHEFDIKSQPGHTKITIGMTRKRAADTGRRAPLKHRRV